jgi:hypothetical protein
VIHSAAGGDCVCMDRKQARSEINELCEDCSHRLREGPCLQEVSFFGCGPGDKLNFHF